MKSIENGARFYSNGITRNTEKLCFTYILFEYSLPMRWKNEFYCSYSYENPDCKDLVDVHQLRLRAFHCSVVQPVVSLMTEEKFRLISIFIILSNVYVQRERRANCSEELLPLGRCHSNRPFHQYLFDPICFETFSRNE